MDCNMLLFSITIKICTFLPILKVTLVTLNIGQDYPFSNSTYIPSRYLHTGTYVILAQGNLDLLCLQANSA